MIVVSAETKQVPGKTKMARLTLPLLGIMFLCYWSVVAATEHLRYKDPKLGLNARIKDLMSRMTLEEKIGQMVQIERLNATAPILKTYSIGSVLSGGGSVPLPRATAKDWVDMVNTLQKGSLSSRLGIPMIYGIDAVHGHNNVYKATIFPHNVGLGVTRLVFIWHDRKDLMEISDRFFIFVLPLWLSLIFIRHTFLLRPLKNMEILKY